MYKPTDRDWTEHFHMENGNYIHFCCICKEQFKGHKRMYVCKLCYTKIPLKEKILNFINKKSIFLKGMFQRLFSISFRKDILIIILISLLIIQSLIVSIVMSEHKKDQEKVSLIFFVYQTKNGTLEYGNAEVSPPITKRSQIKNLREKIKIGEPYRNVWILGKFDVEDDIND